MASELHEGLAERLAASSPEQYRLLSDSGLLAEHLDAVAAGAAHAAEPGGDVDQMASEAATTLVTQVPPSLLSLAASVQALPEDADQWPAALEAYLATTGPEGYAEAVRLGRLQDHLAFVTAHACATRQQALDEGLPPPEATRLAKLALIRAATPIPVPPREWIAAARGLPALTFDRFERLVARDGWEGDPAALEHRRAILELLAEHPEDGRLLPTSLFARRFARQPLYHAALGAMRFGQGRTEEAADAFRTAVALRPDPILSACLGNCLRALHRFDDALAVVKEAMRLHPGDRLLAQIAAGTAFSRGDSARANALFAPYVEGYFQQFPRRDYVESRRRELEVAIATDQLYRDESLDLYDDAFAFSTWWNYWSHFNAFDRWQHAEGALGDLVPPLLAAAMRDVSGGVPAFVELGTMCGEIVDRVAQAFPQTLCFGVDRQRNVKSMNDVAYQRPNLEFVADDIFRFLSVNAQRLRGGMLFHVRTAPFLFPAFLKRLYVEAAERGLRHVALLETHSISYPRRRFQTFEEMEEVAEIRGGGLIHHNYPKVLASAGFRIVHQQAVPPTQLLAGMDGAVFLVAERIA